MSDEGPGENEAWISFLVRKRRFTECVILAWQSVEDLVNQMTVQEFDLLYYPSKADPRVDIILDEVRFPSKLKFLKTMGRISEKDHMTIQEFSRERNKLFHGNIFTSRHPVAISEEEKTRLMDLASKASQIAANRCLGVWTDEGTGDLGNKNVPRPERPTGVKISESVRNRKLTASANKESNR